MSEKWHDEHDEFDFDDELEDQWIAEWDQADREAVELLREALRQYQAQPQPHNHLKEIAGKVRNRLRDGGRPLDWVRQAAGMSDDSSPGDDAELLIALTAATISPQEETGLDIEEESILLSLEHADWLGAIVSAVRDGPGADASPEGLTDGIRRCPEVETESEVDDDDESYVETAFSIIALPWEVLGLMDTDQRLTALGQWILPRALARRGPAISTPHPDPMTCDRGRRFPQLGRALISRRPERKGFRQPGTIPATSFSVSSTGGDKRRHDGHITRDWSRLRWRRRSNYVRKRRRLHISEVKGVSKRKVTDMGFHPACEIGTTSPQ